MRRQSPIAHWTRRIQQSLAKRSWPRARRLQMFWLEVRMRRQSLIAHWTRRIQQALAKRNQISKSGASGPRRTTEHPVRCHVSAPQCPLVAGAFRRRWVHSRLLAFGFHCRAPGPGHARHKSASSHSMECRQSHCLTCKGLRITRSCCCCWGSCWAVHVGQLLACVLVKIDFSRDI